MQDKDKDKNKKKEPEVDFESLYYQAMKENVLMKNKKISIELTAVEIDFLREVLYEELYDIRDRSYFAMDEEDGEDNEAMKNLKPKKDVILQQLIDEKRLMVETIVRKLRFEI